LKRRPIGRRSYFVAACGVLKSAKTNPLNALFARVFDFSSPLKFGFMAQIKESKSWFAQA
jgi:hypothetical protein